MRCFVYKSLRRAEAYVFLLERDAFSRIPEAVRRPLEPLQFSFEFDLYPGRRLARQDAEVVRANLAEHGVHVQFPPDSAIVLNDGD